MAKRGRPKKVRTAYEEMNPDTVEQSAERITSLLKEGAASRGLLNSAYKDFSDVGGHKAALRLSLKMDNMDDAARGDFWRALHEYVSLFEMFSQGDMLDDPNKLTAATTNGPAHASA